MLKNIIEPKLIFVKPDDTIVDASKLMAKEDVGCVLVVKDKKPVGILTDRDIVLRCMAEHKDAGACKAEDIMTKSVICVYDTDGLYDCVEKMKEAKARRLPVIDKSGYALGIVSFGDILSVLSKEFYDLTSAVTAHEELEKKELEKKAAA